MEAVSLSPPRPAAAFVKCFVFVFGVLGFQWLQRDFKLHAMFKQWKHYGSVCQRVPAHWVFAALLQLFSHKYKKRIMERSLLSHLSLLRTSLWTRINMPCNIYQGNVWNCGKKNHACKKEKRLNESRRKVIFQIGLNVKVSATSTLPQHQPSSADCDGPPLQRVLRKM